MTSYNKNNRTSAVKCSDYKCCIVPLCRSTDPIKIYFPVPKERNLRIKWCKLMRRNPAKVSFTSNLYCCDDHFDIEKDTIKRENEDSEILSLKTGVVPHKFACQASYRPPEAPQVTNTEQGNENIPIAPVPHLVCLADEQCIKQEHEVGCSIRRCPSGGGKNDYIQFFPFPKDEIYAQQWLRHCEPNTIPENGRVCSLHFTFNDYYVLRPKVLNATAIPSLNIDDIDINKLLNPYLT